MTREEAIKILSPNSKSGLVRSVDGFLPTNNVLCALDMAITALLAQQPRPLDRSRWEGCEYCKDIPESILKGFCYACGRPLTEKAWSELERRIGEEK